MAIYGATAPAEQAAGQSASGRRRVAGTTIRPGTGGWAATAVFFLNGLTPMT